MLCIWRLNLGHGSSSSGGQAPALAFGAQTGGGAAESIPESVPGSFAPEVPGDAIPGDVGRQALLRLHQQVKLLQAGVADVVYREDGKLLAVSGWDGKVGGGMRARAAVCLHVAPESRNAEVT